MFEHNENFEKKDMHREEGHHRPHIPYEEADTDRKLMICLRELEQMLHERHEGRGQRRILVILSESESTTQRDLTERLGIRPGSASEILAKLERAELITRTPNEDDHRTTDIRLTDAGKALAEESKESRKRSGDMFVALEDEEKETLLSLLEKVCGERLTGREERPRRKRGPLHHEFYGRGGMRGYGGPHGHDGRFHDGGHRGRHGRPGGPGADEGEDA